MKNFAYESTAPTGSEVEGLLAGSYFYDAWAIEPAEPQLDALGQFLRVHVETPWWINRLMRIRNSVVGFFGLKNLGDLSQINPQKKSLDYVTGERVGIFKLLLKTDNEILLGDDDTHLKVVVSVHRSPVLLGAPALITVTTVVHVKNWLGKMYMLPVAPAHRVIVRTMVKAIGNAN